MKLLTDLNPAQESAVTAAPGPVLVLAGPGSGKTRVLTFRAAYLVQELGNTPRSIMAVTFTNKAAREMALRVSALLDESPEQLTGISLGTFHAFCARMLRREAERLPFTREFVIFDEISKLAGILLTDRHFERHRFLRDAQNTAHLVGSPAQFAGQPRL